MIPVEEDREAIRRIMREESRSFVDVVGGEHDAVIAQFIQPVPIARRAVRILVRIFALLVVLAATFLIAWYLSPPIPLRVALMALFYGALGLLLIMTGPMWPKHRRRTPPQ